MKVKTKNNLRTKLLSCFISAVLIFSAFVPVILFPVTSSAATRNISFDTTYQDSLSTSSPSNTYYFETTSQGSVLIQFETSANTSSSAWKVSLIRESDAKVYDVKYFGGGSTSSSSASARTEYSDLTELPAGKYYVTVAVSEYTSIVTSSYKITVIYFGGSTGGTTGGNSGNSNSNNNTNTNPNNSFPNATSINLNTTMSGSLKSASDLNYYKITVPYHGSLVLSFSVGSATNSGNWAILLYDKNEKQLQMGRVGSGGEVINSIRTNKLDKLRLPPGDYYIKVAPYNSSAFSGTNYTIYADYTAERSARFEREFNDSQSDATNILINAPVTGNLSDADDIDYFRFGVSEYNDLRIEFTTPDNINQDMWTIYLQDSKGGVATYYAGGSGGAVNGKRTFVSPEMTLEHGIYYIVIYPYSQDSSESVLYSNSDYILTVHSDTAPIPSIPDDEYILYPTETPGTAYGVNREISGQIRNSTDINIFEFGLNFNGSLTVDFISPAAVSKQAWILNIYDTNNILLYSGKYGDDGNSGASYNSGTKTKTSDKLRLPAGSYYAQVLPINAYDFSTSQYKIFINYIPESKEALFSNIDLYEAEYNNTPYTANTLVLNSQLTGNLSDHTDIDYFIFDITQYGTMNISFTTPESVLQNDWVIELYTSEIANEPIYKEYFGADGNLESLTSNYKIMLSRNMRLQPGTYYIKISAYNIINYSNQDYKIKINFIPDERDGDGLYETEPNNNPETANILPFNTEITGDIFNINDIDYFKICVEKSQDIQIKFSVNSRVDDNFWSVKLYDEYHRELKSYKIGETGTLTSDGFKYVKTEKTYLYPGDYYIAVSPYTKTEFSSEEYILKVLDEAGQKFETYVYPEDKPSEWALYEVGYAYGYNLVPQSYMRNFTTFIKREEFCMLIVKFLEVIEDKYISEILAERNININPAVFTDTNDLYILSANALGLVNGRGNGRFDPNGNITREEAAAMLMRVGVLSGINKNSDPLRFNDSAKFNIWAVDAIDYVSGCMDKRGSRIMNGYTDGGFHPGDTYTREQAFMTIFRLYALKTGV